MALVLLIMVAFLAAFASAQTYSEPLAKSFVFYENTLSNIRFLILSSAAYSPAPAKCLANVFNLPDIVVTATFSSPLPDGIDNYTLGFAGVDPDNEYIFLSFRGTNNVDELIAEGLTGVYPTPYLPNPSLLVNSFFYACEELLFQRAANAVMALMQNYPSYPLYVTGHSLGAGIASITAMHLVDAGIIAATNVNLYTFGEPRVGMYMYSQQFTNYFPNAMRVTHDEDCVVHLVPCPSDLFNNCQQTYIPGAVDWGYHSVNEIFYPGSMPLVTSTTAGQYQTCTGTPIGEDPSCAYQHTFAWVDPSGIPDHTHYFNIEVGQTCALGGY